MANTSSAEKRIRQERKRSAHNRTQRSRLKTAIKKVNTTTDPAEAQASLTEVSGMLDRMATRRIIHPNKAARKKSQLARALNKQKAAKA